MYEEYTNFDTVQPLWSDVTQVSIKHVNSFPADKNNESDLDFQDFQSPRDL